LSWEILLCVCLELVLQFQLPLPHFNGSGFAATPDGYVSGPPEALEYVRFGDGWALYDLTDVPERNDPERVAAALKRKS